MYNTDSFTYGYELELGDVDRSLQIPDELGSWEYSETDIINMLPPYQYVACDPLGISPPMGGEINVKPGKSQDELLGRIEKILKFFKSAGNTPTPSCVSHGHVHVYIPGLKDDVPALKRLVSYIKHNQKVTIEHIHAYKDLPGIADLPGAKAYLKLDCGRLMPDYMCDNIINLTTSFEHFIKLHAAGKDGVSMGRPFRYAINTYCMKHTGTIEFRFFRNSIDMEEIGYELLFVELFMGAALNDGPNVETILNTAGWKFPPFIFDYPAVKGWLKTKYPKERGQKKNRVYHHVS